MLLGALLSYIVTKLFAHKSKFERGMDELIEEEKKVLKNQSYKDYFGKA